MQSRISCDSGSLGAGADGKAVLVDWWADGTGVGWCWLNGKCKKVAGYGRDKEHRKTAHSHRSPKYSLLLNCNIQPLHVLISQFWT